MLPFVVLDRNALWGVSPWAICVVAGAWIGTFFAERRAERMGYDLPRFRSAVTWVVLTGFVFGHLLDLAFYHPQALARHPLSAFRLFDGQSSCGGFVGAVLGGIAWKYVDVRARGWRVQVGLRPEPLALMPVSDLVISTFPITWVFARLGCALVHDHPGVLAPAGSPFAVAWPTGPEDGVDHAFGPLHVVFGSTSRYDMGLLELGFTILLAFALVATWRRRFPTGAYTAAVCLIYAPVRFAMDFLRVTGVPEADPRYAGLTFAQWFCLAMFACGVAVAIRARGAQEGSQKDQEGQEGEGVGRARRLPTHPHTS